MVINQLFETKLVACNQLFHTVPVPQVEAVPRGQMPYRYNKLSQAVPPVPGVGQVGQWDSRGRISCGFRLQKQVFLNVKNGFDKALITSPLYSIGFAPLLLPFCSRFG